MNKTTKKAKEQPTPERPPQERLAGHFRLIYANTSRVDVNIFDVQIGFGVTMQDDTIHEQQVVVAMSPQHFKALVSTLTQGLAAYEEVINKLP